MEIPQFIQGFSALSRTERINLISEFADNPSEIIRILNAHLSDESNAQLIFDEISENTVSNYLLPYCIAPNFVINTRYYMVPMVTEESSVVAAASAAAKFWAQRGGFKATVSSMRKKGHVHFLWKGKAAEIERLITGLIPEFYETTADLTANMQKRGGGIIAIELKDLTSKMPMYYQLELTFDTNNAMGANFINSCLERISAYFQKKANERGLAGQLNIIMAILSNHTPECLVECHVTCPVNGLGHEHFNLSGAQFAEKFKIAVDISRQDVSRAVTHNKGIFNGIDAVMIATGNDFRAVEAAGHAYAARNGQYKGLTQVDISDGSFMFSIEMPLSVGTVGGLTRLHPLAAVSMKILHEPQAADLMAIGAAVGLASNFSAVKALITGGIQKGHMKLHLSNVLNQLKADKKETLAAHQYFRNREITFSAVDQFLNDFRNKIEK
jgi:hydroxymethylglutaryl-CoA reductase